jgi:glycosyltransferase involved in cell wall biosynthesis
MNIAIFSPNKNPYSETFIQAHKNYLKGRVFYYYGSSGAIKLEGSNELVPRFYRYWLKILRILFRFSFQWINEKSVLKSLQKNSIDVILVEYGTHAFKLNAVLKESTLPFVVHFHGYDASVSQVIKNCENYKTVFKEATKVIVVSKVMESKLLDLGCPRKKLSYNVYGPNPEFERVEPLFSKKQFVAIGRFTDKKAPYYTIMAFNKVLKKHPDAKLIMAGDGLLLNTCKNIVRYFGISDNVEFVGIISPREYRAYLKDSIAFVQHSITAANGDMEGTPVAILEASSAGLPVISTFHAGIPDVIHHEKTGLLVQEHQVNKMAEYMVKLLDDKSYAVQLGNAGKILIRTRFSLERHIKGLQEALESQ